jgi:hypothetical protein
MNLTVELNVTIEVHKDPQCAHCNVLLKQIALFEGDDIQSFAHLEGLHRVRRLSPLNRHSSIVSASKAANLTNREPSGLK